MTDTGTLAHYLAEWGLTNPHWLAQSMTSTLYTVTYGAETVVLKLLAATETEEQRGALALRHFDGRGAVHLLRHDDGAHLLEYAPGDALVAVVEQGEDTRATQLIAQVIEQLHSVPQHAPPDGLMPLDRWFGALFAKAEADRQAGAASIYRRGAAVAAHLLADPRDVCVLHGDIHHYNIRRSTRGWLAFDPKGLIGERAYDCANALCNPVMPALVHNERRLLANAAMLAGALKLEPWRVLAFTYAYACLNASWWLDLGGHDIVQWALAVAAIVEPHLGLPHLAATAMRFEES